MQRIDTKAHIGGGGVHQHVELGARYVLAMRAHSYGPFNETATDRTYIIVINKQPN